ncbi:MAG: hypothetical protein IKS83_00760 [Victivallales bacterium]|nr:hypothetical protein [Victivallales bacterium]
MNAVEAFSLPGHPCNCAQAVAVGAGREDLVSELAACGGGHAPEGRCGALHAALLLAPPEKQAAILAQFQAEAGAMTCREIKSGTRYPCVKCVELASRLLSEAQG